MCIRQLAISHRGDLLVTCFVGPKQVPVTFLVDTGAQISAIKTEDVIRSGVWLSKQRLFVADAFGTVQAQALATVKLRLSGEEMTTVVVMVTGPFPLNLLELDVLRGKVWTDDKGGSWSFGAPPMDVRLLQAASLVPPSKVTNVKPYPVPLGAREGITPVLEELREQGVVVSACSPFKSPVWPVWKPNGKWRLTVDYRRRNANTGALTGTCRGTEEDTGCKCCIFGESGRSWFENMFVLCFVNSPQVLPLTLTSWGAAAIVCAETASQTSIPPNLR